MSGLHRIRRKCGGVSARHLTAGTLSTCSTDSPLATFDKLRAMAMGQGVCCEKRESSSGWERGPDAQSSERSSGLLAKNLAVAAPSGKCLVSQFGKQTAHAVEMAG